jgi:hypothetical protein
MERPFIPYGYIIYINYRVEIEGIAFHLIVVNTKEDLVF